MKKNQKSKLRLNKLKIAKVSNSYEILGGNGTDDANTATDTKTNTATQRPTSARPTQIPTGN